MTIRSIAFAACASAALLAAFPAAAACSMKAQPIPVKMQGAVPLQTNGLPVVDVKVNGKTSHFLLESSAPVNTISSKLASSQKLAATKASTGQDIVTVSKFELAGSAIDNASFMMAKNLVGDMDGEIGQTFLGQMDVEYDLPGGKVLLAKSEGCDNSNMAYWAKDNDLISVMPLVPSASGVPFTDVKIAVNGAVLTARFDTAAPFSVITEAGAAKAGVKTSDPSVKAMAGRNDRWLANFTVNVGGEEAKNAPLMIAPSADASYDVLIGADYLLTHHVFVANSQHKVYATRAGFPNAPMFTAHQPPPRSAGVSSAVDDRALSPF
jgi:hypothetical protein